MQNHINDCLLWPNERASAQMKLQPSDFIVHEVLNWTFTGHGEHIFLYVEKTDCNTIWISKQLARFYGIPPRDVGYSGLKDRHAITRQYFSIRLPGVKAGDYEIPTHDEYRVISHQLHDKKLKRGNHPFNDFVITLKNVNGEQDTIEKHLQYIHDHGCPNIFDSQRFGNDNSNLENLQQWINGELDVRKRNEKSLLLSALRSMFFNQQLGTRVRNNSWQNIIADDMVMLNGTNSHFQADTIDETLKQRCDSHDIHPAGMLIGENSEIPEIDSVNQDELKTLLQKERLTTDYRSMRLIVSNMSWEFSDDGSNCVISMRLPKGAYASGVIKQVFDIS